MKAKGIDEVLVYCVNDMAVMQAWFDDMMIKPSSIVTPLADPTRSFTKALDLEMEGTPPQLGYVRSKRFAAVFDDGKCTNLFVSAAPGDPAGDDDPSASKASSSPSGITLGGPILAPSLRRSPPTPPSPPT